MSRKPRNFYQTNFFHVMCQGINKKYIFEKSEDIKFYIKLMYNSALEDNAKIIAYCVMNNHVHILLKVKNINSLSNYMKRINQKYSFYFNKKYKRVGYVFRDRFKAQGIYTEKQYFNCINYIYNNPVKAGITKKPQEYPYSNYRKIKENMDDDYDFIDTDEDKIRNQEYIINEYLKKKQIQINDLKTKKYYLADLVTKLTNANMTARKISVKLDVGRTVIRNIIKNKNKDVSPMG